MNRQRKLYPMPFVKDGRPLKKSVWSIFKNLVCKISYPIYQPKVSIVLQNYCDESNKIVFGIKYIDKETIEFFTASEISLNKDLINSLHPQEAHLIGYVMANDKVVADQEMIERFIEDEESQEKLFIPKGERDE